MRGAPGNGRRDRFAFEVQPVYVDAWGARHEANPDAVRLLRAAVGDPARVPPEGGHRASRGAATCYLPAGDRAWGWAAQLYAARSARSWGIGDLDDLRRLATWSRGVGAGYIQLNPLH